MSAAHAQIKRHAPRSAYRLLHETPGGLGSYVPPDETIIDLAQPPPRRFLMNSSDVL